MLSVQGYAMKRRLPSGLRCLDQLLLLWAVCFSQHSSCSADCHVQLQRNFTLNEPSPMVHSRVFTLNNPGCGGHMKFRATKSGSPITRRYLPWMVLLVTRTLSGVYRYCSGTIITRRHVLTAAHCTFYTKQDPIANVKVYYGLKGLQGPFRRGARFLRHPMFDMSTLRNDIAILMMDKCFEFNKNTGSACLPVAPADLARNPSLEVYWKVQENGAATMFADILTLQRTSSCRLRLGDASFDSRVSFCGMGTAICKDDSAAPVFSRGTDGRGLLVGILSYSADCSSSSAAKVFTRVDIHVPWLKENLRRHEIYEPLLLAVL
ncbi:chymotrypsinogen B-like isoform X1 [Dermacentor andersoni]|uniref:chymotrypsinogen B-like isoform X1 n=1 Tax=Dermacentor andersoni TaxID=34620 RepID=UPI002416E584|nr:chymotrypsinogen B-like isoform X1 [Dermacentor andersoni]